MAEPSYELYRPAAHPAPERSARPARAVRRRRGGCCGGGPAASQRWVTISAICVAIWLMTGAGYFWPMWVMLGLGIPILLRRR